MDVHETLGRLYQDYAVLRLEYRKLLDLVGRIQAGEVDPARVMVLPGDAWEIRTDDWAVEPVSPPGE